MLLKDAPITTLHLTHNASQNQVETSFFAQIVVSANTTAVLSRAENMIAYQFGMQAKYSRGDYESDEQTDA